jgi:hypothetical protein
MGTEKHAGSGLPLNARSALGLALRCVTDAAIQVTLLPRSAIVRSLREEAAFIEAGCDHDKRLMMREDVKAIRDGMPIEYVVGLVVKLTRQGKVLRGRCPFCCGKNELMVHPGRGVFHCFGCAGGGDVFRFVMMRDECSFSEAGRRLMELMKAMAEGEQQAPRSRKS